MTEKKGKTFELTDRGSGRSAQLPVRTRHAGTRRARHRRNLYRDLEVFTYDPGFGATAATESRITYIDGDAGVLLYRGYPIEQLAENELLHGGRLPAAHRRPADAKQLEEFSGHIRYHTMINESLLRFFNAFHHNAHPMAMVSGVVASMSGLLSRHDGHP